MNLEVASLAPTPAAAAAAAGVAEEDWRDWGNAFGEGLPVDVLARIAGKVDAQTKEAWGAFFRKCCWSEPEIQAKLDTREREGNSLFIFALVCRAWREAQLKVGGQMRTRVRSDVIPPGRVALAKWALAEGCPREGKYWDALGGEAHETMLLTAASFGHMELVKWLIREEGFVMDAQVMREACGSGNLELAKWLRARGCEWSAIVMTITANLGQLEVLKWLRANGCP